MSHDSIYKNDELIATLSPEIRRRVNLMAGQIEVAGHEFNRLNSEIPQERAADMLRLLESYYYKLSSRKPDVELSMKILRLIIPLYGSSLVLAKDLLRSFLERNLGYLTSRSIGLRKEWTKEFRRKNWNLWP
jgi:hypothetical protein